MQNKFFVYPRKLLPPNLFYINYRLTDPYLCGGFFERIQVWIFSLDTGPNQNTGIVFQHFISVLWIRITSVRIRNQLPMTMRIRIRNPCYKFWQKVQTNSGKKFKHPNSKYKSRNPTNTLESTLRIRTSLSNPH